MRKLWRGWMTHVAGLVCFLGVLLFVYHPVLFEDEQFSGGNVAYFDYPLYLRVQQEWNAGRLPLWNPWQNGGMPLLGNPMAAVLYPGKVVHALLPYRLGLPLLRDRPHPRRGAWRSRPGPVARRQHHGLVSRRDELRSRGAGARPVHQHDGHGRRVVGALGPLRHRRAGAATAASGDGRACRGPGVSGPRRRSGGGLSDGPLRGRLRAHPCDRDESGSRAFHQVVGRPRGIRRGGLRSRSAWPRHGSSDPDPCGRIGLFWRAGRPSPSGSAGAGIAARIRHAWLRRSPGWPGPLSWALRWPRHRPFPVLEFVGQSLRASGLSPETLYRFSLAPVRLAEAVWPNVFGSSTAIPRSWLQALPPAGGHEVWVKSLYLGGLTIALASGALGWSRVASSRVWLSSVAGVALVASLGKFGGPLWWLRQGPLGSLFGPHREGSAGLNPGFAAPRRRGRPVRDVRDAPARLRLVPLPEQAPDLHGGGRRGPCRASAGTV